MVGYCFAALNDKIELHFYCNRCLAGKPERLEPFGAALTPTEVSSRIAVAFSGSNIILSECEDFSSRFKKIVCCSRGYMKTK